MRFILAAIAFVASVVALVMGGIQFVSAAQATTVTADGTSESGAPVMVVHDDVFSSRAGLQDIRIEGDGPINVIIGRTSDVEAWVADARHDVVTVDDEATHSREHIHLKFTESGTEETVPNPIGNDLWYEEHEGEGSVQLSTVVAPGYSMLITSNGESPAPSTISVTWPLGGYAPLSGPLLVIGAVLFVLALALLWWAIAHRRRVKRQLASASRKQQRKAAREAAAVGADGTWSPVPWSDELAEDARKRANELVTGETVVDEGAPIAFPTDDERADVVDPYAPGAADAASIDVGVVEHPADDDAADIDTVADDSGDAPREDVVDEAPVMPEPMGEPVDDEAEPDDQADTDEATTSAFAPPEAAEDAAPAEADEAPTEDASPAEDSVDEHTPIRDESSTWTADELADASEPEPEPEPEPSPASAPAVAPTDDDESKWRRPRGRNRSNAPRRQFLIAPVAMVVGLTLAGCAPQYWPAEWTNAEMQPTGTATSTVDAALIEEGAHPPALNMEQIQAVVTEAAELANEGDAALSSDPLEPRFEGDALAERIALYQAKKADDELPSPAAFPSGDVVYAMPESTDQFPRTIFVVVNANAEGSEAPFGMMLVQDTARDNFKVASLTQLAANVSLPEAAPTDVGSASIRDLPGELVIAPDQLAGAYADVIANGDASEYASMFSSENDSLRSSVNQEYRDAQTEALDPDVTDVDFQYEASDTPPLGMVSLDGGAIVAVSINEIETVSAANDRARITVAGATAALSGIETTEYGFTRTYTDQVLLYVPSAETGGEVQFLGVSQAMTSASELSE